MALINFVGATEWAQLVLFAKRVLSTTDTGVSGLYAAGAAGIVVLSLAAAPIRRRLSFKVTALGALVVSGLATALMAVIGEYWAALVLWAAASGFGLLFNINTGALRQALVPPEMLGRVMTVATVLAWSAIPLGALAGAAIINATDSVSGVYVGAGLLTAAIAGGFAFSPIRHGDRLLAEVAAADADEPAMDGREPAMDTAGSQNGSPG
jgi:MFS family permease